jgi:hypothetical protein
MTSPKIVAADAESLPPSELQRRCSPWPSPLILAAKQHLDNLHSVIWGKSVEVTSQEQKFKAATYLVTDLVSALHHLDSTVTLRYNDKVVTIIPVTLNG